MIGLNSHQRVLVLGNPAFLPWLSRENKNIVSARKLNDAVKIATVDKGFDRLIVGREFDFSHWNNLMIAAAALATNRGVLVYFPKNESDGWAFRRNIEFAYPLSNVWETGTTFGHVIQVELIGGCQA